MSSKSVQRIAAAGGIAYVVLSSVGQLLIQVGGMEPAFGAGAAEIVGFFESRDRASFQAGGFLSVLGAMAFIWFVASLWAALRRPEPGASTTAMAALGSGMVTAALQFAAGFGWGLAIFRLDSLSADQARLLFDLGNYTFATLWVPMASMLLAAGIGSMLEGVGLPRWLGWAGIVIAVGLIVAHAFWASSAATFVPWTLTWVWIVVTSIVLIRRAGAAEEAG